MQPQTSESWPLYRRVFFRFLFLYFILYLLGFPVSQFVPFLGFIDTLTWPVVNGAVEWFNSLMGFFDHPLVPVNGSGDTSWAWTFLALCLTLAAIGAVVWSLIPRAPKSHPRLEYLLWNAGRYFLAYFAFSYGIIKVFALQMGFPTLSTMATPLGDLLPMRLSWQFMGYSTSYQVFAGLMEVAVAMLLLYRRTVTLGLFVGFGVFLNVMMLNLSYDVPVKIFSTHLTVISLLLLIPDLDRIFSFFIFNRPVASQVRHFFSTQKKYMRVSRWVYKAAFIFLLTMGVMDVYGWYEQEKNAPQPFAYGVYDVQTVIRNGDTIPVLASDTLVWKDVIFDRNSMVSVGTTDTLLRQGYRRGYFNYARDSAAGVLKCFKYERMDSIPLFNISYRMTPSGMDLATVIRGDSVRMNLVRSKRHFKLAERQFHWLSEYNR